MDTNLPSNLPQTPTPEPFSEPVSTNRLPLILGIGGAVLVAVLLLALFLMRQVDTPPTQITDPTPPVQIVKQQDINLTGEIVTQEDGSHQLQLTFNPVQPLIDLTTFSLMLTLTSDTGQPVGVAQELMADSQLTQDNWSYAISRTEMEGNSLIIKLAGLYIDTEPYLLTGPTTAVSVPLTIPEGVTTLNLELDLEESKFFDKQAQVYFFENSTPTLTITP
jgi:hypothetical protein